MDTPSPFIPTVTDPFDFVSAFKTIAQAAHANSVNKGFWETDAGDGEKIALMHAELSEALEAIRAGNPPDDKVPAFSGAEAELADCIIRIMDLSQKRGWRIAEAIIAKMAYNATRPHKHGKKF